MTNRMKKGVVLNKAENPLEKFGMFGKEEGFTRVKDLLWEYGNNRIGIKPTKNNKKV